jgi:RNA polymerase sigma factor (sigma-70 family)
MAKELFDRYCDAREPRIYEALVEVYRPLVVSVCRRRLNRPEDVEDAVQETFLKFARHASGIERSAAAWLAATAQAASIDLIRRASRDRYQRQQLRRIAASSAPPASFLRQTIRQHLADALLALDDASRALLVERFFRKTPLRVIAGRDGVSVATISRRAAQALRELATILKEMGAGGMDGPALAEHLRDSGGGGAPAGTDGLRIATHWHALGLDAHAPKTHPHERYLPGWTRPLRVGAFVSHASPNTTIRGNFHTVEQQAQSARWLDHPGIELVGVVEPGTNALGPIERTIREYELNGGLIDATDAAALETLDVILIGMNFAMDAPIARAFNRAVRGGVGLLNEYWTGGTDEMWFNNDVRDLMLSASPIHAVHTHSTCGLPASASVRDADPLIPGLAPGTSLTVSGCGPLYHLSEGARVLVERDRVVAPQEHHVPGLGPARMPVWIVGQLGKGRAIVQHTGNHHDFAKGLSITVGQYFTRLIQWLAEPRRQRA